MEGHISPDDPHAKDLKAGARGFPRGEFMHQSGSLDSATRLPLLKRILKKDLLPILPLFVCVAGAISLAGWSVQRNLLKNPEVSARLNKERRSQGVPEIDDPELMAEKGKQYLDKTLIRDNVRRPIFSPVHRFMTVPSQQKTEEALQSGAREQAGKMTLEPSKAKGRIQQ